MTISEEEIKEMSVFGCDFGQQGADSNIVQLRFFRKDGYTFYGEGNCESEAIEAIREHVRQFLPLSLSLKKIYWDMIVYDGKNEEYREITPYWCNRLLYKKPLGIDYWEKYLADVREAREVADKTPGSFGATMTAWQHILIDYMGLRGHTHIDFTLGYPKKDDASRHMKRVIESITIGYGNPEWGAPKDREVFIIKFKEI